ncbi:MAG: DEAD/DEAH box helicase family protein [Clostridia bacterium]|nr:DEAD/DEAH box helicase family protein [Clostridia bacterium]
MEEINEKEERAARDVLAAYGTPDEEVTASDTTAPNPVAASDGDLCLSDPIEVGASDAPKEPLADLRIAEDSTADEIREAIDRHTEAICQTMSDEEAAKLGEKVLADLGYGEERNKLLEEKKAEEEAKRQAEHVKKVTSYDLPTDYVNPFAAEAPTETVDNLEDALMHSLAELGKVDMEYVAAIAGRDLAETVRLLRLTGSVYQNPKEWNEVFYKGWVTSDEYLSGNVLQKYETAKAANEKYQGYFDANVEALEKLLPVRLTTDQIYYTLGSPWIPAEIVNDFVVDLLHLGFKLKDGVVHDTRLNRWKVRYGEKFSTGYGTKRISPPQIIEDTLNNKAIVIYDVNRVYQPGYARNQRFERTVNNAETALAREAQNNIIEAFNRYVKGNDKVRETLEDIFYRRYGCIKARRYNGSFLSLPGKNPVITMYPHQKDAVARIIASRSTLLAHSVGTGKTYIMIAAAMEMRRMKLSEKNLFVVPNNILGQWEEAFYTLYPQARVYVVYPKDFTPKKRQAVLRRIKTEDYDAVVMAYSSFGAIPVGLKRVRNELRHELNDLPDTPEYAVYRRELADKILTVEGKMQLEAPGIKFEDLRVNSLFVDEAHNFKNITLGGQSGNFFQKAASAHADDMHLKVRVLSRYTGAKSIVFATGTPITNTIADMYVMQKFLQPGQLHFLGLDSFDEWALMFGEQSEDFEIDVDAVNYRMRRRFNRFHNLPELTNIFASVADFHLEDNENLFRGTVDYHNIVVPRSKEQYEYILSLADRAEDIRAHNSEPGDNLLKVTVDGRKAALDMRLVDPTAQPYRHSKVEACAENVYTIWRDKPLVTQLVFCDISAPKSTFNAYDEMRRLLVGLGVPNDQIAYIHDAKSDLEKQALFAAVNEGAVRVLIGSTFKLGTGVNVQRRLFAVHHLDVPWRPADMVQREGRMLRQGNQNDDVEIYRYITDGSFDAYSWQLLESKQRFISQLLYNSLDRRDGEDVDGLTLTYAQIKALAIGDPRIKERVETANKLVRLVLLSKCKAERDEQLHYKLQYIPAEIEHIKLLIKCCKADNRTYEAHKADQVNRRQIGEIITAAIALDVDRPEEELLAEYRGFKLVIPQRMVYNNPRLIVRGSFDWRTDLDIAGSALSAMAAVDRILNGFGVRAAELKNRLNDLSAELEDAQKELSRVDNLEEEIEKTRETLAKLDKELGVNDDE